MLGNYNMLSTYIASVLCHIPGYRISIFDFVVDDTQEEPVVKFVGENILQYVSDQKVL